MLTWNNVDYAVWGRNAHGPITQNSCEGRDFSVTHRYQCVTTPEKMGHSGIRQNTAPTHLSSIPFMWIDISCEILEEIALGTQDSGQGEVYPRYGEMGLDARVPDT